MFSYFRMMMGGVCVGLLWQGNEFTQGLALGFCFTGLIIRLEELLNSKEASTKGGER